MSNLKTTVEELLVLMQKSPVIKSAGYGEQQAYSTSKKGVLYMRSYLSLIDASSHSVKLKLTVTDAVKADLSDRLDVQSRTLTAAKSLVLLMKSVPVVKFDADITYEPTRLYAEDSSEGFFVDFDVVLSEKISVCNLIP